MDRRPPAARIRLCSAIVAAGLMLPGAMVHADAEAAELFVIGQSQQGDSGPQLPHSEVSRPDSVVVLPPLPTQGDEVDESGEEGSGSGVQTIALGLAGLALISGLIGLGVVTRRGRIGANSGPGVRTQNQTVELNSTP